MVKVEILLDPSIIVKFEAVLENISVLKQGLILTLRLPVASLEQHGKFRGMCDNEVQVELQQLPTTKTDTPLPRTPKDTKPRQTKSK